VCSHGDVRVRVTAPPADGRANEALIALLAGHLHVPRSHLRIVQGASTRRKLVEIDELSASEVRARLGIS